MPGAPPPQVENLLDTLFVRLVFLALESDVGVGNVAGTVG